MPRTYIHLSDLHFGQETGSDLHLHEDVRERLIEDARNLTARESNSAVDGIIVTGDIAFSGKQSQYQQAGQWLERLREAVNCELKGVFLVPGNHDVDRDEISSGCEALLEKIKECGEEQLERYLQDPLDSEVLYRRFKSYRDFAEAYACPIDTASGYTVDRQVPVGPRHSLRFIGANSALVCSPTSDEDRQLLLGARQRTFPLNAREELVVLCHHPLHWLRDSTDASQFVRARARVFISGHTHERSSRVERNESTGDLVFISAGAAVPASNERRREFTYNRLSFDWDEESASLTVGIEARTWNAQTTRFTGAGARDGTETYALACAQMREDGVDDPASRTLRITPAEGRGDSSEGAPAGPGVRMMADRDDFLRLRFFKDLTVHERAAVLARMGVLPFGEQIAGDLTHTLTRHLVDGVLAAGKGRELGRAMDAIKK